jgi:hypothetical protein
MPRGKKKKGKPGRPRKVKTPESQPTDQKNKNIISQSFICHVCGENLRPEQVLCIRRIVEMKGKKEIESGGPLCRKCGGYE